MKFQPVQPGKISLYDYMRKLNFIPVRQDSFPHGICLNLFTFLLVFRHKHVLNYFFIRLRLAETITRENFVPEKGNPGSTIERSHLAGMKLFTCNRRIQFIKSLTLPGTRQNGIEFHPGQLG